MFNPPTATATFLALLTLATTMSPTHSTNVQQAVALIDWIPNAACPNLRGYITFDTDLVAGTTSFSATFPTIENHCANEAGTKAVTIAVYPLSRSYSGDTSATRFGPSSDAHTLYTTAALSYPYTVLKNTITGNIPAPLGLTSLSTNSIVGRAVVLSIDGSDVAAGVIGRRQVAGGNVNIAGGPTLSSQSPTLVCLLSDASTTAPGSADTKTGSLVISSLGNNGGLVIGAKLETGFTSSSNHRVSLHSYVHVPENTVGSSTATAAAAMLGPVLTYTASASASATTTSSMGNLPCSKNSRAGDLGNVQGVHYYARLSSPATNGWEQLVGAGCAVWKNPMRTCSVWEVGCASYEASDKLLAVGVIGLSDEGALLHNLGTDSLKPPASGVNYNCLSETVVLATSYLYPTKHSGSSNNYDGTTPLAKVTFLQDELSNSVSISIASLSDTTVPSWLLSSNGVGGSTLRAVSIQTTGDGSFGDWDQRDLTKLGGTFHPSADHQRALPPNQLRRSGDVGSFDLNNAAIVNGQQHTFEYYMDTKFGENMLSLTDTAKSIVGRGFTLHSKRDTGLGDDTDRGNILLYGIIGTPPPPSIALQTNLARGSQLKTDQQQLICVLRNVKPTTSSTKPYGTVTMQLNGSTVIVTGTFHNVDDQHYQLQIHQYGDATGASMGNPIGTVRTNTTACYDLPRFGYLGTATNGKQTTDETSLHTLLKAPQQNSLSSFVGKSCALSETGAGGTSTPVAVGVLALTSTTTSGSFQPLQVPNGMLENCYDTPPKGQVQVPQNSTVQHGGKFTDNQIALIVGLCVGIPVLLCLIVACAWSYRHYQETHGIIKHTKSLKLDINQRGHHEIFSDDDDLPAPPMPINAAKRKSLGDVPIGRPMSFKMPNGRVMSVRLGQRNTESTDKPLPEHPHVSMRTAGKMVVNINRLSHSSKQTSEGVDGTGTSSGSKKSSWKSDDDEAPLIVEMTSM